MQACMKFVVEGEFAFGSYFFTQLYKEVDRDVHRGGFTEGGSGPPPPPPLLKFGFSEKIQESVIDQSRIVPAPSLCINILISMSVS